MKKIILRFIRNHICIIVCKKKIDIMIVYIFAGTMLFAKDENYKNNDYN